MTGLLERYCILPCLVASVVSVGPLLFRKALALIASKNRLPTELFHQARTLTKDYFRRI